MLFNHLPGIGLVIGSNKIKLAWVKKKGPGLQIIKYGSIPTPVGTVDSGCIADPERLGKEMSGLARKLGIKGKRVVSAVGGQDVFIRILIMPSMKLNELKDAVYYQAMSFLPIPIEEASTDIFPLRNFEDKDGKKIELFFAAVRRQQVKNLEIACLSAGLKLAAIEIEPLSIYRLLGASRESTIALLSMSSSSSFIAVFKGGIPVFYRYLSYGWFSFTNTFEINASNNIDVSEIGTADNEKYDDLVREIIFEVNASLDFYEAQGDMEDELIGKLILFGTGAVNGLNKKLTAGIDRSVEIYDLHNQLLLPPGTSQADENDLQFEFPAALGLAAREAM